MSHGRRTNTTPNTSDTPRNAEPGGAAAFAARHENLLTLRTEAGCQGLADCRVARRRQGARQIARAVPAALMEELVKILGTFAGCRIWRFKGTTSSRGLRSTGKPEPLPLSTQDAMSL
ncbi:unnamed protein product [Symbiodinium natans]|uniref:Uncharacterized protein n=1 Tax=Symbiodinium natans TaxID=878477 RepID=A0A812I4W8_9DINO|nr:unnamed protein product [Symbiodinium natans]